MAFKMGSTLEEMIAQRADPRNAAYRAQLSTAIAAKRKEAPAAPASGGAEAATPAATISDPLTLAPPNYENSRANASKLLEDSMKFGQTLREQLIPAGAFGTIDEGRTTDEQGALDALKAEYQRSTQRSPEAQLAMTKFQNALEGLNSEEGVALREGARADLDKEYAQKAAIAKNTAARSGGRGGAIAAQGILLDRDRASAQRGLSRDFVLKNVDIKNQALNNFGGYVRGLESDEGQRRQGAANAVAGQSNVQTDRDLGKKQFNLGQQQNQVNANLTAQLGGAGLAAGAIQGQQGTDAAYENVRTQLELARRQLAESSKQTDLYGKSLGKLK